MAAIDFCSVLNPAVPGKGELKVIRALAFVLVVAFARIVQPGRAVVAAHWAIVQHKGLILISVDTI